MPDQHSQQHGRISQQPPAHTSMSRRNIVRQSSDTRGEDDVSIFSFSESIGSGGWCWCFGSGSKNTNDRPKTSPKPDYHPERLPSNDKSLSMPTHSSPPQRTSMTGYDNSSFVPYAGPALNTVAHPRQAQNPDHQNTPDMRVLEMVVTRSTQDVQP